MHLLQQVAVNAIPTAMITATFIPGDADVIRPSKRVEAAKWSWDRTLPTFGGHAGLCVHAIKRRDNFGSTSSSGCFHQVAKYVQVFTVRGRRDESKRKKATSVYVITGLCFIVFKKISVSSCIG